MKSSTVHLVNVWGPGYRWSLDDEKCGPLPHAPYFHFDLIHVIGVPGLPRFFAALPLPCIIANRKKNKRGRPWNEAKIAPQYCAELLKLLVGQVGSTTGCYALHMAAAASVEKGMAPPTSPVPPFLLMQQLPCAVHSTHVVHMVAALAGCRTALVGAGWTVSHHVSTNRRRNHSPLLKYLITDIWTVCLTNIESWWAGLNNQYEEQCLSPKAEHGPCMCTQL